MAFGNLHSEFEAAKERFDPRIIITVTLSAHALNYPNGPQLFAHRLARVLAAAVGVENECTSPEKTDTKINLSVTSYEFGPCKENVHLEADTTLGFNLLF